MEQQGGEGAELKPGDRDYRAFVGPPAQYDVKAATQFSLLCALGLRENHNLLDVGCGSLRAGRLFIPYLGPGRYFGIEPNQWLVEEGIKENLGDDLVALRRPSFSYRDDFAVTDFDVEFDYVVAQSIFTHSGPEMIGRALHSIAGALKPDGLVAANFIESGWPARSFAGTGWHYGGKGIVSYRGATFRALVADAGLVGVRIPWGGHVLATWWVLARDERRLPTPLERRRLGGASLAYPRPELAQRIRTRTYKELKKRLDPPMPERTPLAKLARRVTARVARRI